MSLVAPQGSPPMRASAASLVDALMSEDDIQRAVFEHLERRGRPGIVFWHPKNGGVHQAHDGQRLKNRRLGVLAGIQDVHVLADGRLYCLELKRKKRSKTSDDQISLGQHMMNAGAITGFAFGLDAALDWLEAHGLLLSTHT